MKTLIYLDYAAATPMDQRAIDAAQPYLSDNFFNPSAVYQSARLVRADVERARGEVASVLGVKDQEIIFTAGGTEANNLAIHGILSQFPDGNIVVSGIEHESVLEPALHYNRRLAPVTPKGIIDLAKLELLIDDHTVLISIMYANNEVGTVQPLKEVAAIIAKKRAQRQGSLPLYLHTDACQAANYLDLQVSRLGVDLMTLNGGKIYGAKQSGCLYVKANTKLQSLIQGGGQENNVRSGTENIGSIVAFATMLQYVQSQRKSEIKRLKELSDLLLATLSQNIPGIVLNGDTKKRLPNNLNLTLPGAYGERLLMELDEAGVMVATGSACTASNDKPSHVLLAMGLSSEEASASIRITLGQVTTIEEIRKAADIMVAVMHKHIGYNREI